jgi:hypothetical protein
MNDSECKEMEVFCGEGAHSQVLSSPGFFNCGDGSEMKMKFTCKDGQYSCEMGENQVCYYTQTQMKEFTKDASWENDACEVQMKCMKVSPAWSFAPEESSQTVSVANLNSQPQESTPQMQQQESMPQMQQQESMPQMQQQESMPQPSVGAQ